MKKYELIIKNLNHSFQSGEIAPGDRLPTEQQLAETYNVSRITVRAALDALEASKLISRSAGRGTYYIGPRKAPEADKLSLTLIILNSVNELIYIAEGIENATSDIDAHITMHITNSNTQREVEICQKAISNGTDGIIVFPASEQANREYYAELVHKGFPIVFLDRSPLKNCNLIQSDNELGMFQMTEHLIELGHTEIAYITSFDYSTLRNRFQGYVNAMKQHGLPIRKQNIITLHKTMISLSDDPKPLHALVEKLIETNPPTAIMCSNDILAVHTINCLRKLGAPYSDIPVTGFDNANYSSKNLYSITTIEQNFYDMGKVAAQTLVEAINNRKSPLKQIQIPVKLIKRASTLKLTE